jgi:V8-like Glu-specific endopeptidase
MREAVREGKSKNWGAQMSKTTLIPTLMAVISAFSSPANAQAPLKTNLSVKSDQPIYVITAHTVVHDDGTNSQLDNYVIVYGSEVLTVQYAESQISTVKPGASKLEQVAPGKNLHLHTRFGSWPQGPDVSQVPHIGVPIRACEMDTKYPDSDGHPVIAIQSVSSPCISRNGDTLHYSVAPNGGIKMYEYVNFDILEATNNVGVAAAQSTAPRKDIPAIAKSANGAIVSIVMSDKDGHAIAQGSGFLVSKDGVIVTNYHVISEGSSAIVKFPDGAFYVVDGVLAFDKARDVAVIKAHGENFRTLTLGNSDQLQVGEEVIAIGNPLSLESTVSNGIVSGIRTVEEEGGKFLQVTTPISPGSSGGPLFNMAGEVVGITTLYLKGGENLNFAIPINDAKGLLLAKSSKIQALPNETEPVKAQTRDGNAPSSVASPSAGSTAVGYAATAEQIDCRARADGMLEEERKRYSDPPGLFTITHATDSSHVDPFGTGICFVLLDIAVSVKHTDGKTESTLSLDVLDAIGRTNYAEYFVDTVDNVPEIACSVKRPGWAAPRICTTGDEFTRLINMLFGL